MIDGKIGEFIHRRFNVGLSQGLLHRFELRDFHVVISKPAPDFLTSSAPASKTMTQQPLVFIERRPVRDEEGPFL